jgi:5-methylcytosine-specific restriction protein B
MMNDNKIIVLTHNPKGKWKGTIKKLEEDRGYKNWNKSINVSVGDIILLYISKTVEKIQYILEVTEVRDTNIDLKLIEKLSKDVSNKLSFKILKQHGLKPSTVNYILNNNKELYDYVTSIIYNRKLENYTEEGIDTMNSLNQILYGPPGTGKTYNTINKALEIILEQQIDENIKSILQKENQSKEERKILTEKFKEFKDSGQIEFITFHQSYGYEEFIEGIKADLVDSDSIKYKLEKGIFQKLSKKAEDNFLNSKKNSKFDFISFINDFAKLVEDSINEDKQFVITHRNDNFKNETFIKEVRRNSNGDIQSFITDGGAKNQSLSISVIERDLEAFLNGEINTFHDIKPSFDSKSDYHGNAIYYFGLFKEMKKYYDQNKNKYLEKTERLKNYILIIDEINRGNISKIFGELITLIEDSKRLGKDEAMELTLPYSNVVFGVPQNLYIIGTMNTADRSIAQIDTALRRRFVFEEMMPKPWLLKNLEILNEDGDNTNINVEKILTAINERIEYIYDREHTIGHSYFMDLLKPDCNTKVKLDEIFRVNIIPLLAEYFYGDWEDILEVLNDDKGYFIIDKTKDLQYKPKKDRGNKVYTINKNKFEISGYINIYNSMAIKEYGDN